MKNAIVSTILSVAALLTFTNTAHATQVVAEIQPVDFQIHSISMTDDGMVKILKIDGSEKNLPLSKLNNNSLLNSAQALASAELQTESHMVVCMMMVSSLIAQNLYVLDQASGEMRLTLSYKSCAISTSTSPKDPYMEQVAQELKSELLVLAQQFEN